MNVPYAGNILKWICTLNDDRKTRRILSDSWIIQTTCIKICIKIWLIYRPKLSWCIATWEWYNYFIVIVELETKEQRYCYN